MKRTISILAAVGMLALLLVLMIAVVPVSAAPKAKVTICHLPGTPNQKTMQVPEPAVAGHISHGDVLGECEESAPPEPPEPTITGTVKVTICHKPGTPAQKTLMIPKPALTGHLGHGDVLTACEDLDLPEPVITGTIKVTICHKPATPAQGTMVIPVPAIGGHLGHGDVLTACEDLDLPEPPVPGISSTVMITICHKPGTPAEKTMMVAESATDGHVGHGDVLGVCEVDSAVPLEWVLPAQAWLAPWQPAPL